MDFSWTCTSDMFLFSYHPISGIWRYLHALFVSYMSWDLQDGACSPVLLELTEAEGQGWVFWYLPPKKKGAKGHWLFRGAGLSHPLWAPVSMITQTHMIFWSSSRHIAKTSLALGLNLGDCTVLHLHCMCLYKLRSEGQLIPMNQVLKHLVPPWLQRTDFKEKIKTK